MVSEVILNGDKALLIITGSLLLGAFIRSALNKVPLPYTVYLMIFGFSLGTALSIYNDKNINSFLSIFVTEPPLLLKIFLPAIIFESSFGTDLHTFQKCIGQIILLSIVGYTIAALLHGLFAWIAMSIYNWTLIQSLLYGVILSATDPVAVVAILKEIGTSKHLGVIIEGESLLNDGIAIVFFQILSQALKSGLSVQNIQVMILMKKFFLDLMQAIVGGVVSGYLTAKVEIFWLSRIHTDVISEITITFAVPYILYIVCDLFKMSGVVAVVVLGLMLNGHKTCLTDKQFVMRFWELLAYFCNTIIFVIVGLLIADRFLKLESLYLQCEVDILLVIESYLFANLIRLTVFGIFWYFLSKLGYGFTWKDGFISVWGGLRGAVGLVLAIHLAVDSNEPKFVNYLLIHVAGIVMLTLLINATTVSLFLDLLGSSEVLIAKQLSMFLAITHLNKIKRHEIVQLKQDRFLADSDWNTVESTCVIDNPYIRTKKQQLELLMLQKASKKSFQGGTITEPEEFASVTKDAHKKSSSTQELFEEARVKILQSLKANFWQLYYEGQLSHHTLHILNEYCELAEDKQGAFINIKELVNACKAEGPFYKLLVKLKMFLRFLLSFHTRKMSTKSATSTPFNASEHRASSSVSTRKISYKPLKRMLIRFHLSAKYKTVMIALVAFSCISVTLPFISVLYIKAIQRIDHYFLLLSTILFFIELVLRFYANDFNVKYIFCKFKHIIEILVLIVNVTILILLAASLVTKELFQYLNIINYIRLLQLNSVNLNLWHVILNNILDWVNLRFNKRIFVSYGVTKGYVLGIEFILKHMHNFAPTSEVGEEIEKRLRDDCQYALDQLVKIQVLNPGTTVSVKTKHSIQRLLAVLTKGINEMSCNGLIDEKEADKILEQIVVIMTKRVQKLPSTMAEVNCEPLYQSSIWLSNCKNIIEFLVKLTKPKTYSWDEVIFHEGSEFHGIYFIVAGIVEYLPPQNRKSDGETTLPSTAGNFLNVFPLKRSNSLANSMKSYQHDIPSNLSDRTFNHTRHEIYCEGEYIGAFEYLNKVNYQHTCKCITNATIYFIPADLLETIFKKYDRNYRLTERLWLEISISTAENLLLTEKNNEKMYKQDLLTLRRKLYYAYIHCSSIDQEFESEYDAILVQGRVKAKETVQSQTFAINADNHSLKEGSVQSGTALKNDFIGPCFINKDVMMSGVERDSTSKGQTIVMLILSDRRVSKRVGISLANIRN